VRWAFVLSACAAIAGIYIMSVPYAEAVSSVECSYTGSGTVVSCVAFDAAPGVPAGSAVRAFDTVTDLQIGTDATADPFVFTAPSSGDFYVVVFDGTAYSQVWTGPSISVSDWSGFGTPGIGAVGGTPGSGSTLDADAGTFLGDLTAFMAGIVIPGLVGLTLLGSGSVMVFRLVRRSVRAL